MTLREHDSNETDKKNLKTSTCSQRIRFAQTVHHWLFFLSFFLSFFFFFSFGQLNEHAVTARTYPRSTSLLHYLLHHHHPAPSSSYWPTFFSSMCHSWYHRSHFQSQAVTFAPPFLNSLPCLVHHSKSQLLFLSWTDTKRKVICQLWRLWFNQL